MTKIKTGEVEVGELEGAVLHSSGTTIAASVHHALSRLEYDARPILHRQYAPANVRRPTRSVYLNR